MGKHNWPPSEIQKLHAMKATLKALPCKKCGCNVYEKIQLEIVGYDSLAPERGTIAQPIKMYRCFECKTDLEPQARIAELQAEATKPSNLESDP